jgi:hypothetical protein
MITEAVCSQCQPGFGDGNRCWFCRMGIGRADRVLPADAPSGGLVPVTVYLDRDSLHALRERANAHGHGLGIDVSLSETVAAIVRATLQGE